LQRLVSINGQPLTTGQRRAEDERIRRLVSNPDAMRREAKKQRDDAEQARTMLKIFPDAFRFRVDSVQGNLVKLAFEPNPAFHPPSRAAQVFHDMSGTVLVDAKQKRLVEISGRLATDVKFAGGVLGHLDKGGTFFVRQQDLGLGHWEMTLMDVQMNGKALLFKNIAVREKSTCTNFHAMPSGANLREIAESLVKDAPLTSETARR
jgi:hypothetical protein